MILQSLAKYYDRLADEGVVAPEGFKQVGIHFLLCLNQRGEFTGLQDSRTQSGKKLVVRTFVVPEERERSGSKAWQTANLLWDHYGYVLAWPKSHTDEDKEMAKKQHGVFIAEVKKLNDRYPDDKEIGAVYRFLSMEDFSSVFSHPLWKECAKIPGCKLTFHIEGLNRLVCQNDNVKAFISSTISQVSDDKNEEDTLPDTEGVCLITGERGQVARLHPRTPILGTKSNAKIVSFQKNMGFDSYGKQQSYNAPVSKKAAFAYTTALNQMLARDSRQKLLVGADTIVFWAEKKSVLEDVFADIFGEPAKENPEQIYQGIRTLFESPRSGAPPIDEDYTRFYVLGLAPNIARIAIRLWYQGTVGEVVKNIRHYFDDLRIEHAPFESEYLSIFRLLVSTAVQGKAENIQPNLAGEVMKSILAGTPYPQTLLASAVRRIKAERKITYPRASLIKAVLVRDTRYFSKNKKEVSMSLDRENTNPGYLLGRLFAVLESAQKRANPRIDATIRDRFYGSASSTPVTAFPRLLKLKNHHISKLENKGEAVNLEKQIGEIMEMVSDFPALLSLQDQGRFAIGYYHQRQDFFRKREL